MNSPESIRVERPSQQNPVVRSIGTGIYTLREASRLTGAPVQHLRRWLFGYEYRKPGTNQGWQVKPMWKTQLAEIGRPVIGFWDLLEVRFVRAFVARGLHLRIVRACSEAARREFRTDYPFTSQRFLTDGRTIFYEAVEKDEEGRLVDLKKRQQVFHSVIRPSLYEVIEFDAEGLARRWYPVAQNHAVFLDPEIAFGTPVVADGTVPTKALYAAYLAENKQRAAVAQMFEVPPSAVDAAVRFEQRLAA